MIVRRPPLVTDLRFEQTATSLSDVGELGWASCSVDGLRVRTLRVWRLADGRLDVFHPYVQTPAGLRPIDSFLTHEMRRAVNDCVKALVRTLHTAGLEAE